MNSVSRSFPQQTSGRPRIALVADIRDWAFANIARHIEAGLSDRYEFTTYYTGDYSGDYDAIFRAVYGQRHDLVHFFWREVILHLYIHILRTRPSLPDGMVEDFVATPLSFSVYDHCLLGDQAIKDYSVVFKYLASGYTVSSERLRKIYEQIEAYPPPRQVLEDGVDLSVFAPRNLERFDDQNRPLIVGWAGNSRWGKDIDGLDYKGMRTIVKPALESLGRRGIAAVGNFADRSVAFIPHAQMVDYYNSLDVYVCASIIEGTPNPVLEAMACGIPVVSTDVGIVPQLFGPEQQRFILDVRTSEALGEKLALLAGEPMLRKRLSAENLGRIKSWTRQAESPKWERFFSSMLQPAEEPRQLAKRACVEVPYNYALESTVAHFLRDSLSWKLTHPLRFVNWHLKRFVSHAAARRRHSRSLKTDSK